MILLHLNADLKSRNWRELKGTFKLFKLTWHEVEYQVVVSFEGFQLIKGPPSHGTCGLDPCGNFLNKGDFILNKELTTGEIPQGIQSVSTHKIESKCHNGKKMLEVFQGDSLANNLNILFDSASLLVSVSISNDLVSIPVLSLIEQA